MIRIEEVKRSERKKGRFLVRLEDGNILRVTEEELLRFLESAFTFEASEIVHKTQGREPSAPQHV